MDRYAAVGIPPGVDLDLERELALARDLHAALVPKKGRRARRRLGAQDVLRVMRAAADDPEALAAIELRYLVEELLSRGRHPDGARVTHHDLAAAGLTIDRPPPTPRNLLSAPSGMARSRDLPSAHAPLGDGPPVSMFRGFEESEADETRRDENPIAERVASRFASATRTIPLPVPDATINAAQILSALRGRGIDVDAVHLEPGSWPGQASVVGLRNGSPVLYGAVAIDLQVQGQGAMVCAEIRIHPEDA